MKKTLSSLLAAALVCCAVPSPGWSAMAASVAVRAPAAGFTAPVGVPGISAGSSSLGSVASLGAGLRASPLPGLGLPPVRASLNSKNSGLILPGGSAVAGEKERRPLILTPEPKKIILPERPDLTAPKPRLIIPDRVLTEEERDPEARPTQRQIKELARSLASEADPNERNAAEGAAAALGERFDGLKKEDAAVVADYFKYGARAPKLSKVREAGTALFRGLLPNFYRRIPLTARYDESRRPSTGHLWSVETGHIIEIAPAVADAAGNVPSAFGIPGLARVQDKVEQLLQFAHEYAHVVFDAAVKKAENHPPQSSYSAMTEGFAVTLERLLIDRALGLAGALGMGPRDTGDFATILRARRDWLDAMDTHYAEGILAWRKAYEKDGTAGVLKFLSALSARRMIRTPRAEPAYQLALGDPDILGAYLGDDPDNAVRKGLEAFGRAAKGEELDERETQNAAKAVEAAGAEGRRRVFERALLEDKRLDASAPVEAAFALARLSTAGAAELAVFLARTIQAAGGAKRLFGRPGPNEKLNAIVAGAEGLPFDEAARKAWDQALTGWIIGRV